MQEPLKRQLSVLPLRDIVVFPHMIVPFCRAREICARAGGSDGRDDKQDPAVEPVLIWASDGTRQARIASTKQACAGQMCCNWPGTARWHREGAGPKDKRGCAITEYLLRR